MQTNFTATQLRDPGIAEANNILRSCVHCGFCTATCPTYVLLGDERDSPRGRIYLIKEMLERDQPASAEVTKHIDRCLSCLSCMTTCPASVNYMHLVDQARSHIEKTYKRPRSERFLRNLLVSVLPHPWRFWTAAVLGRPVRLFGGLLKFNKVTAPFGAMLQLIPKGRLAPPKSKRRVFPALGNTKKPRRVILHPGCAQQVLRPEINDATIRLLTRLGVEVVVLENPQCCGALVHHLGREDAAHDQALLNVKAWAEEVKTHGADAIIVNASGCGTVVKDYGFMLRSDAEFADLAARISSLTNDISEYIATLDLPGGVLSETIRVAYHSACSLQHGQSIDGIPKQLLTKLGYDVHAIPEGHLCCGSAGTYNITQVEISDRLLKRKIDRIDSVKPDIIATGNIGCITQLARATGTPVVHSVELLDWATGGPMPPRLLKWAASRPVALTQK